MLMKKVICIYLLNLYLNMSKIFNEISIYIPVYNGEKTIKQCIDSILDQTKIPKKILVINDNSLDNTKNILENYKDKIEIINNIDNKGISYSRNFAVNYLKTKYIASIDADVVLSKNWLETIYNTMVLNKVTYVGGKLYEKYIDNPCNYWRSIRLKQNWGEKNILNPPFIFGCNNILDTSNLNLANAFKNDGIYYMLNGEDTEFCKFLKKKNFNLFYDNSAECFHLQNDNYKTLAERYWRYVFYGDGMKKRNLFKTLKNIARQIKKTFIWLLEDLVKFKLSLIKVDIMLLYHLIKIDIKKYRENL